MGECERKVWGGCGRGKEKREKGERDMVRNRKEERGRRGEGKREGGEGGGGKKGGRDRGETAGELERGDGGRKEKKEKGERNDGGRKGGLLVSPQPQSYITCEGLYGVIISCYGNKIFSILLVADQGRDFVGGNTEFTTIVLFNSSKYSDVTIMPTCHQSPVHVCMCVSV